MSGYRKTPLGVQRRRTDALPKTKAKTPVMTERERERGREAGRENESKQRSTPCNASQRKRQKRPIVHTQESAGRYGPPLYVLVSLLFINSSRCGRFAALAQARPHWPRRSRLLDAQPRSAPSRAACAGTSGDDRGGNGFHAVPPPTLPGRTVTGTTAGGRNAAGDGRMVPTGIGMNNRPGP